VNRAYLDGGLLTVEQMGRGFAWLDTGTPDSLLAAADFVATLEKRRQGFRIACPEEIAFTQRFIDRGQLQKFGMALDDSEYAKYVQALANTP
jgi:glucose-1-phosphate thymidylyltransferase